MGKRLYKNWNVYFFQVSINYNFSHTVRWKFIVVKQTGYKTATQQLYILPLGLFQSNLGKKKVSRCQVLEKAQRIYHTKE